MNGKEDNLEKYIRENRRRFDIYTPDPAIKRRLFLSAPDGRKRIRRYRLLRVAAVILIIVLPSALIVNIVSGNRKNMSTRLNPQLRETEIYYEALMGSVFNSAGLLFNQYPELKKELMADISELEDIGEELRTDLKDNIDNREVVEALIRNYRIRIQMLEDLLEQMPDKDGRKEKTDGNEI
jgi:hypothetical protein